MKLQRILGETRLNLNMNISPVLLFAVVKQELIVVMCLGCV